MGREGLLVVADETGYGTGDGGSMHPDLLLSKAPDPVISLDSGCVKDCVTSPIQCPTMPVVAVGLNDEPRRLEHEIGLEASEHRLVHLEVQAALLKLVTQKPFNASHLLVEVLAKSCLAVFLALFRGTVKRCLSQFFSCFWRVPLPRGRSPQFFSCFWRHAECSLAMVFSCFRCLMRESHLFSALSRQVEFQGSGTRFSAGFFRPHSMFNYNTWQSAEH